MIRQEKIVTSDYIKANTKMTQKLGEGTYAMVYLVEYHGDVAVLKIGKNGPRQAEAFMEEARMVEKTDGAGGVPKLLLIASDKPGMVTSYCPHPSLYDLMRNVSLASRQCVQIFRAIATALDELHGAGISHNDFKEDNLLIDVTEPRAYIIDMGMSCLMNQAPKNFPNKSAESHKLYPIYDYGLWCGGVSQPHCDTYTLGYIMKRSLEYMDSVGAFSVDDDIAYICDRMMSTDVTARPSLLQVMISLENHLAATESS